MSSWREDLRVQRALWIVAKEESDRVGHPRIDVEHLLVALVVVGGPATRVLEGFGVNLSAVREAVAEEHRERVRSLGLIAPEVAALDPIPDPGATDITFSDQALAIVRRKTTGRFDLGLLGNLLDEPSGLVPAVLARLGVAPAAVRTAVLAAGPTEGLAAGPTEGLAQPEALDPDSASCTAYIPAPQDRVWDLVSNPNRRMEWDYLGYDSAEVRPNGTLVTIAAIRTQRGKRIWTWATMTCGEHVVTRLEAPRMVEWHTTFPSAPEVSVDLRITLEPDGPGTRITLVSRRRPVPRLMRPLIRPLWLLFLRQGLYATASNISRALR